MGTMSNVQVINNSNESTDFKDEWVEGVYGEWMYVYNPNLKLLFVTFANGDYENIYNRLVVDKGETFSTKADKVVSNIEEEEVDDALGLLILRDGSYSTVKIDWSDKEAVEEFLDS
jgi:hypothetical protein